MLIIVEGVDRVGKSTFCDKLKKTTGFPVFHDDSMLRLVSNNDLKIKYTMLIEVIKSIPNLIIDRFHLTELVYNKSRGDDFFYYNIVEDTMSQLGAILVLVDSEDIDKSSLKHGCDLSALSEQFDFYYKRSILDKMRTSYSNIDECIEKLLQEN